MAFTTKGNVIFSFVATTSLVVSGKAMTISLVSCTSTTGMSKSNTPSHSIKPPINKINDSAKLLATGSRDIVFDGKGYLEIEDLNNTLNYAVIELKKTEKLQKELLANISHDLKTPITLISGYAQMMKDIPDENTSENLDLIIGECNRLNLLVNDLLELSLLHQMESKDKTFYFIVNSGTVYLSAVTLSISYTTTQGNYIAKLNGLRISEELMFEKGMKYTCSLKVAGGELVISGNEIQDWGEGLNLGDIVINGIEQVESNEGNDENQ